MPLCPQAPTILVLSCFSMKTLILEQFTALIQSLEESNKTNEKLARLKAYFQTAPPDAALWVIYLLSGKKRKRPIKTALLREWAAELASTPLWLLEECYHTVGDLAETLALILPPAQEIKDFKLPDIMAEIEAMSNMSQKAQKSKICFFWQHLPKLSIFVFNKLLTGGFRIGISKQTVMKALAANLGMEIAIIAQKLGGKWHPQDTTFEALLLQEDRKSHLAVPYPFYLAYPFEDEIETLPGTPTDWQAEWKWDGIRLQLIFRENLLFVWSRGEEDLSNQFPELQLLKACLPSSMVLDGELLVYKEGKIGSFNALQYRLGRKKVQKSHIEKAPVILMVYDLLELEGKDLRDLPLEERRRQLMGQLKDLPPEAPLQISPSIEAESWENLKALKNQARAKSAEGLMLKKRNSPYLHGRKKGDWWKWKVSPFTVDAVLIYAQSGHGRRANLYTDYTFAIWREGELVPFTKAYSGLTDEELKEVDKWIRKNTLERFGPVRKVTAKLVFEIAFEGISSSKRHKSGIALRFPRIKRWRRDLGIHDADHLHYLKSILEKYFI